MIVSPDTLLYDLSILGREAMEEKWREAQMNELSSCHDEEMMEQNRI